MNDFHADDRFQRAMRDKLLKPFYEMRYRNYVFLDTHDDNCCAMWVQREIGVDTFVLQGSNTVGIEEKIVRWPESDKPHGAFAIETASSTIPGRERDGWLYHSVADTLLYGFMLADGSMTAHLIPMVKLKAWAFTYTAYDASSAIPHQYRILNYPLSRMQTHNQSECRIVPIGDVWSGVEGCQAYHIEEGGRARRLPDEEVFGHKAFNLLD